MFKALRELWGDHRPVAGHIAGDCRQIKDLFASLPPNSTKRWPRLSLQQAAERARAEGTTLLNPTTINSYMARLSTLFKWATREEFVDRNPAEGLTIAVPELDPRAQPDSAPTSSG